MRDVQCKRQCSERRGRACMSVGVSGPFLSMLSANSTAFFSVVSNCSLQPEHMLERGEL